MLSDSSLWLSNADGLWKQNRKSKQFRSLDIPFSPGGWVSSMMHDETTDDYYFGMTWESYGVPCWNGKNGNWTYYQPDTDRHEMVNTFNIIKDSQGVIWAGTGDRGLWIVDTQNKKLKQFTPPDGNLSLVNKSTVFKILEDSKKNLWLGTEKNGVIRINSTRDKVTYYSHNPKDPNSIIEGTHIRGLEEDRYGRIWIGTLYGLCTFDPETEKFSTEISEKIEQSGIRKGEVMSIVKDTTGAIWLTALGQGLIKVTEKTKNDFQIKIYQTDDGLKDLRVGYMTKDKNGGLWIVNNGLLYLNPYNERYMFTGTQNGLLFNISGETPVIIDSYGNVFCSGQIGLGWQKEAEKHPQTKILNLIVENVTINDKPLTFWNPYGEKAALRAVEHNQNNITFGYTAICFEDYDQVRYRYKLEGFESDWKPPTQNLEAQYTNLMPGKYSFVVDVAYKGNWLGLNQYVEFKIKQAYWKTWWFISLIMIILTSIIFAIYQNLKLQRLKQQQIRSRIASDLHDDIGSTLSSISIMSDLLQSRLDNSSNSEEMLRKIGKNARNMLDSMDDIIWSVNPQNDNFHNIIVRIREYAVPLLEMRDILFTIDLSENILTLQIPMDVRRNLYLIAKEAVNNAAKYSGCRNVAIEFTYAHTVLKMTISDDGKGFDTTKDYGRNGLQNMRYRAEKIGGKVTVRSAINKGTSVVFIVKAG